MAKRLLKYACLPAGKVLAIPLAALALLVTAANGQGKSFRVNSSFDLGDLAPGNGLCVAYVVISPPFVLPFCTLRAAIEESNGLAGADVIELPGGYYALDIPGEDEDRAAAGDLDISDSLTIRGSGAAETIIDGQSLDRLVDIVTTDAEVVMQNLSLVNGRIAGGAMPGHAGGGAVRNLGVLTLDTVVLRGHQAGGEGGRGKGGIIFNAGTCRTVDSTLEQGWAGDGGALFNAGPGVMTVVRSTLSGNRAERGGGVSNDGTMSLVNSTVSGNGDAATIAGGGIDNNGILRLEHVTVTANQAQHGGGLRAGAGILLRNSIIAANMGEDCSGPADITSGGANLDSDGSCRFTAPDDKSAVSAGLRRLADYGGPTLTHGLLPASPARDSAVSVPGIAVDQRGVRRPAGAGSDIGAFEYDGYPILPMIYPLLH